MRQLPRSWFARWSDGNSAVSHAAVVDALTDYCVTRRQDGAQLYFLTLTYKEATDTPLTLAMISRGFDDIYGGMLRCYVHHLNFARPKYQPLQPIIFAFPDRAQSKFKLAASTSRGIVGLHHHAIVAARPEVAAHFERACLMKQLPNWSRHILTSDIQRIESTDEDVRRVIDYATAYAFKKLPKEDEDDRMLVYPATERWKSASKQKEAGAGQRLESRERCPSQRSLVPQQPRRPATQVSSREAHRAGLFASCLDIKQLSAV